MKPKSNPFLSRIALAGITLALGTSAKAVDYYWNTTTTGSWGAGANWSDNATSGGTTGVVPLAADSVFFNQSSVNGAEIITLDGPQSIAGITFGNTGTTTFRATAAAVTDQTLTLGAGGITMNTGAGNVLFSQTPATYGVLTIDMGATTQLWTNNATSFTAGPVIGSGQLTLSGANSSSANNLGQFTLDLSGHSGNLILNNSRLVNSVATNGFGTTGTITVNNGAQLGVNTASTTNARAVTIHGNGWYDNGSVQRGAIRFLQDGNFSNTVTLGSNSMVMADSGRTGTFSGVITGGNDLTIGNSAAGTNGTIIFSGATANDYSGLTTVSAGILRLDKTAGLNAIAGNVLVTNVGTLSNTADNQIANTATVNVDSSGALWSANGKSETIDTLNLSGAYVANKGFTTGVAGKLTVTNLSVSGGGVTLNSAGAGLDSTITANTVTNTGGTWVFGVVSGTQSLVIGSGGLTIGGGSTMSVNSAATATTFISLGGNVTSQANANSNVISTGGTNTGQLRLNATRTFDVADGAAASDLTVSAVVADGAGTGGIIKTGAGLMTLGRANTFTGSVTIKEGTLLSTAATAITTSSSLVLGDSTGVSTTPATFDITTASVTYTKAINVVGTNQVNTIRDSNFTLGLSGPITLTNANLTLNQATTAGMNVSGGVTGTGNLIISGSGTGGSLNLTTAALNHAGTITNNGSGASATNISSLIGTNVTGVTQNSATSTLTLSGPNTYTGTTTIAAGILNAGVADGVGTGALGNGGEITFTGGRLQYSAASAGTDYSARIKNSTAAVAIDTNGQNASFSGVIDNSNTLGLTKSGAGTLTLAGASANTYTGVTAVTGGILAIANKDALNGSSAITVATGGATLRIDVPDATTTTLGAGKSISIAGNGDSNFGALQGAASINATWAGSVSLAAGVISRIGGGTSGTLTVDGVISGANATAGVLFSRAADSTTILNKVNTYTGETQFFPGGSTVTLKMGIANAINSASRVLIGSATSGTAYFDLNGHNQNIRALSDTVAGDLVVTNGSLTNDAVLKLSTTDSQNFGGWIQDGANRKTSLIVAGSGTQTLSGANTYTGNTTVEGGTLAISGAGSIANTPLIQINGSTTLSVSGITGTTFTLGASQTLAGNGTVLAAAKTLNVSGTLSPGASPGAITQNGGAMQLAVGGDYNWQIHDASGSAGTGYDTTSLINGGVLDLSLLSAGNTFNINLWSLSGISPSDVIGDATGFDNTLAYSWTLFSQDSEISGFSADKFSINTGAFNGTSGFSNDLGAGGVFGLALANGNKNLNLTFTPVPEPSAAALLGTLGALILLRRRRA